MSDHPTPQQMRRALARADRGAALDVAEAAALLAARGDDLDRLLRRGRAGSATPGCVAAGRPGVVTYSQQGLHPADPAVPGPLPLLHVRHRAGSRRGRRRSWPPTRCSRSPARAPRWAARRRCSPSATGPRTAGRRPASGWTSSGYDSTLDYLRAMAIAVLEETGLLPHLNPGVLTWAELQRLKPVAPSMGMMLETTSTPAVVRARAARTSARPTRSRRSGCGCWRTPAGSSSRSPPAS